MGGKVTIEESLYFCCVLLLHIQARPQQEVLILLLFVSSNILYKIDSQIKSMLHNFFMKGPYIFLQDRPSKNSHCCAKIFIIAQKLRLCPYIFDSRYRKDIRSLCMGGIVTIEESLYFWCVLLLHIQARPQQEVLIWLLFVSSNILYKIDSPNKIIVAYNFCERSLYFLQDRPSKKFSCCVKKLRLCPYIFDSRYRKDIRSLCMGGIVTIEESLYFCLCVATTHIGQTSTRGPYMVVVCQQ